jgi:diguanylate cyclase (GGDEF)-like protein/PAS domain S-box-containing protein
VPLLSLPPTISGRQFGRLLQFGNLAVLAVLALTTFVALRDSRDSFTARAFETAENLAGALGSEIGAELRQIDNALQSVAQEVGRLEPARPPSAPELERIVQGQKALLPQVDTIRVTDADGVVLNGGSPTAVSVADRAYFKAAREHPENLAVSEPLQGRIISKWGIIVARARRAPDGSFAGVIYSNLSSDHLREKFANVSVGSHGAVTLRSGTLQLVARYAPHDPERNLGLGTATVSENLRDALRKSRDRGAFITRTTLDGIERVTAYRRVPGTDMLMLVGLATDDFYAPWRRDAARMLALACLLESLVVALSMVAYRQHRRQRAMLRQVADLVTEQRAMLENELVGMARMKDRRAVWHNNALARMFGYGPRELEGHASRALYPDDASYEEVGRAYQKLVSGQTYRTQLRMQRKDGSRFWVDLSGTQLTGGESLWMMQDIDAVKESEVRADHRARHDPLTGLGNRAQFDLGLDTTLKAAQRAGVKAAVCFIDLDGFKAVNDEHGHEAGDFLLREVARRLSACVRGNDFIARLGGDEFVVVLGMLQHEHEAHAVLRRLLNSISKPVRLANGADASVGASIGMALYPAHGEDAKTLLARADEAMYSAKNAGKNRFAVHGG